MKKSLRILILISFLIGASFFYNVGLAVAVKPGEIKISSDYGRISESFDGGGDKLVVHIQDAHTNYEAQKNAAYIIEDLINKHGLYLILVEGGSRDVTLDQYREGATLEERKKMADDWLREGTVAGEEYLNIASDYRMKLQGIEDRMLYDQNMAAFLEVDKGKEGAVAFSNALSSAAAGLKAKIYSRALRELDDKRAAFKEEKISIGDYIKYLNELAKAKKADLSAYQNFINFINSMELEKTIDFNAVERERADAIDALSKKMGEEELNELMSKSVEFKNGQLNQAQYHAYLRGVMAKAKADVNKYPDLEKYIRYVTGYEKIDSAGLFKELKMAEEEIEQAVIANDDQRRLAGIARDLELLTEFIDLKLAPDDFDYYMKNEGNFNVSSWAMFLQSQLIKYKLTQQIPQDTQAIQKVIAPLKEFYLVARKRDDVFLRNTKRYMEAEGVNIAVLIAGGFHTPSLMRLFKENNISYVVVSPKVLKPTDEKLYHKILTEGWAPVTQVAPEEDEE